MGRLTDLNPPKALTEADIPGTMATDAEVTTAITTHVSATDPHLQYATQARGDLRYVQKFAHYFRCAPSQYQSIPQNTATKISFDLVSFNIGLQFANSRLTANQNESWRITTMILTELPAISRVILSLFKNGNAFRRLMDVTCPAGNFGVNITPADVSLQTNDYLEISIIIQSISTGKIYGDASGLACWWEGSRVG
jgi:hypothetical protein